VCVSRACLGKLIDFPSKVHVRTAGLHLLGHSRCTNRRAHQVVGHITLYETKPGDCAIRAHFPVSNDNEQTIVVCQDRLRTDRRKSKASTNHSEWWKRFSAAHHAIIPHEAVAGAAPNRAPLPLEDCLRRCEREVAEGIAASARASCRSRQWIQPSIGIIQ
jgi:hypothetical protein